MDATFPREVVLQRSDPHAGLVEVDTPEIYNLDLKTVVRIISPGRPAEGMIDIYTVKWWRVYGGDNLLHIR